MALPSVLNIKSKEKESDYYVKIAVYPGGL